MVYKTNFVVVIKSDGKILREKNNEVQIPFGSEYSILLKNLDSRKAVVSVDIDGKNVTSGSRIIVDGNSNVELTGEMINNKVHNRFKFIKKTEEIVKYRGDRIDDGIVRVEVTFEEVVVERRIREVYGPVWYNDLDYWHTPLRSISEPQISWTYNSSGTLSDSQPISCNYCNTINEDEGITVKGSETEQNFVNGYTKNLETQSTVFTIRLCGINEQFKEIKKPVFTKDKIVCSTCGTKHLSSMNFCSHCGTKL